MSRENVEVIRRLAEENRSDDLHGRMEGMLALFDPSCEYKSVMTAVEGSYTYRGHDGLRRYFADLADRWQEWRTEAEDVLDVSPDTVLATIRFRAIGKDSGIPVEARLGTVVVLSGGKIVQAHTYPSKEEALEAVGLRE